MKEFKAYKDNKSIVLTAKDFEDRNLYGEKLVNKEYDKSLSYTVYAQDEDGTMRIEYFAYGNEEGLVGWHSMKTSPEDEVFGYDCSKTLEENLEAACDYASDMCEEMEDMAAWEEGPEKYFGAPALM